MPDTVHEELAAHLGQSHGIKVEGVSSHQHLLQLQAHPVRMLFQLQACLLFI